MTDQSKNTLYPIFLKLHQMQTVIVGGGEVGLEKISFMLKNSPDAKIKLIAKEVFEKDIWKYADLHENVTIEERPFKWYDLEAASLLVLATNNVQYDEAIVGLAHQKGVLCNVADKPALCDFYLGSIISRGDLKIAISTNGKSPTLAKRIRQYLEHALPDNTQEIIDNLNKIRNRLKGDFKYKVKALGNVTKILADTDEKYLEN
jgi:siroheme synthase-like protein